MKPTPTPWEAYPEHDGRVHIVRAGSVKHAHGRTQADWIAELDDGGTGHSHGRIRADADLIVKAVNAHAELREQHAAAIVFAESLLKRIAEEPREELDLSEMASAARTLLARLTR